MPQTKRRTRPVTKRVINQKAVRKHLFYDCETGVFTRLIATPRNPVGKTYSAKYHNHYLKISVEGILYQAHRLAWVYMTGEQPDVVDHVNGMRHDNRWENLRNVTPSENMRNETSHRRKAGTEVVEHFY